MGCCPSNSSPDQNPFTSLLSEDSHNSKRSPQQNYLIYGIQKIELYNELTTKDWKLVLKEILLDMSHHRNWASFKNAFLHVLQSAKPVLTPVPLSKVSSFASQASENNSRHRRSQVVVFPPSVHLDDLEDKKEEDAPAVQQENNFLMLEAHASQVRKRRINAKEKIRLELVNVLNQDNGVVIRLIDAFHQQFRAKYAKYLNEVRTKKHCKRFDALYKQILHLVKEFFLKVVKNFIRKTYPRFMDQAEKKLREEGFEPEYILESVIYELLFRKTNSVFSILILALLEKKYKKRIVKFQQILKKRKDEVLGDNQDLSEEFLLSGNNTPYAEISMDFAEVHDQTNPYAKFEIISLLWHKVLQTAKKHHRGNREIQNRLRREFDEDVRIQILLYCIIKSQNQELIVDEMLTKDFVADTYQNRNKGFMFFRGYMMYLMGEDKLVD